MPRSELVTVYCAYSAISDIFRKNNLCRHNAKTNQIKTRYCLRDKSFLLFDIILDHKASVKPVSHVQTDQTSLFPRSRYMFCHPA